VPEDEQDKATPQGQNASYLRSLVQAGKIQILEPGQQAPGRMDAVRPDTRDAQWIGEHKWCTAHGPALCLWVRGRRSVVENALMPDGTRGRAEFISMGFVQAWRRPEVGSKLPPDGWIYGDAFFSNSDAEFVDASIQPKPEPPADWGYPDLEVEMFPSSELRSLLRDQKVASGLYQLFKSGTWQKGDKAIWQCTMRAAGGIVASLRDRGEYYVDYYAGHVPQGTASHRDLAVAPIHRLGWQLMPLEVFESIEALAKSCFALWELRTEAATPAWYGQPREPRNSMASTRAGGILSRMDALAKSGRVSQEERQALDDCVHRRAGCSLNGTDAVAQRILALRAETQLR